MQALIASLLAGLSLGLVECAALALRAPSSAPLLGALGLALAHAGLLGGALAPISLLVSLCGAKLGKQSSTLFALLLLALWVCVVISLGSGHGISASRWRMPILVALASAGAIGLWIGVRVSAASLRGQGASRRLLRLLLLVAGALFYATGFFYSESYQLLHMYLLLLCLCSLVIFFHGLVPRPSRAFAAFAVGSLLLLAATLLLVPNTGHRRAQLFLRTQASRALLLASAHLRGPGSTGTDLQRAMHTGSQEVRERYRIPACRERAGTEHDIILLTIDALRADRLFVAGPRRVMPATEGLARSGSVFTSAYSPSPETSTSLVSLLSGISALALRQFDTLPATLASELAALGYVTTSFQPFTSVTRRLLPKASADKLGFSETRKLKKSDEIVDSIIETLEQPRETPRFFYAHLLEPHAPYQRHRGFDFGSDMSGRYDSELAFVDAQIGRLVAAIDRLGRSDDTIIAITADHGEAFYEHGVMAHGTTLYEEMIKVPLVLRIPGMRTSPEAAPVSTLDLAPTLLAAVGCGFSARTEGQSLLRDGTLQSWQEPVIVRQYDTNLSSSRFVHRVATRIGDDKLILDLHADIAEQYELSSDPLETMNRIDSRVDEQAELMAATLEARRYIGRLIAKNSTQDLRALATRIRGGDRRGFLQAARSLQTLETASEEAVAVIKALEQIGDPAADDVLDQLSRSPGIPARVAEAVTLARGSRGGPFPRASMLAMLLSGRSTQTSRLEAIAQLSEELPPQERGVLHRLVARDPDATIAIAAATTLCRRDDEAQSAARTIRQRRPDARALVSLNHRLFLAVLQCLGRAGQDEDVDYLSVLYNRGISQKKHLAYDNIEALGRTRNDKSLPLLVSQSKISYEAVRMASLEAIAQLGTTDATAFLRSLASENLHLRQAPEHFARLVRSLARAERVPLPPAQPADLASTLAHEVGQALGSQGGSGRLLLLHFAPAGDELVVSLADESIARLAAGEAGPKAAIPVFVDAEKDLRALRFAPARTGATRLRAATLLHFDAAPDR